MRPMLATVTDTVPRGDQWAHEVKWDGMRVLADVRDGTLTMSARSERDVTVSFPELAGLAETYDDMLLDGEVVALEAGRPSFTALADRMHVRDARKAERLAGTRPVTFMVFDVLRLLGSDVTAQPWEGRRALLERLDLASTHWQVPPAYDDGQELFDATAEQGLEGIVSKRRTSPYTPNRRSPDWLKLPHRPTFSAVIGGWRPEKDTVDRLGAVLLGMPGPDGWRYAGRTGSGIAGRTATTLMQTLAPLTADHSPFVDEVPRVDAAGSTWVRPEIVVEVRAAELTAGHRLRQPAYLGIRNDLTAEELLHDA